MTVKTFGNPQDAQAAGKAAAPDKDGAVSWSFRWGKAFRLAPDGTVEAVDATDGLPDGFDTAIEQIVKDAERAAEAAGADAGKASAEATKARRDMLAQAEAMREALEKTKEGGGKKPRKISPRRSVAASR